MIIILVINRKNYPAGIVSFPLASSANRGPPTANVVHGRGGARCDNASRRRHAGTSEVVTRAIGASRGFHGFCDGGSPSACRRPASVSEKRCVSRSARAAVLSSQSDFGWPVCESVGAVHYPPIRRFVEPLWTRKSTKICPRTADFSPRPPKPDRLLACPVRNAKIKFADSRHADERRWAPYRCVPRGPRVAIRKTAAPAGRPRAYSRARSPRPETTAGSSRVRQ